MTPEDIIKYTQDEVVLDECYSGLVGVQVTNTQTGGWGGSVEASKDNKVSYSPMQCVDCTTGIFTAFIAVDGDDSGVGDTTCLDGSVCTLIVGTPQPTTSPNIQDPTTLVYAADNGDNAFGTFPLQACQGDCDGDEDCAFNLYCFQRDSFEAVPGCTGQGSSGRDYCAIPEPTSSPTPNPTKAPTTPSPTPSTPKNELVLAGDNGDPADAFPLGECQGDCDNDGQCAVCSEYALITRFVY